VHMRWFCGLMMFVAASLFARAALAHGVVGHCGCCFEALITQDPAPPDELDTLGSSWAKSSNANTYSISLSSEKVFISMGTTWRDSASVIAPVGVTRRASKALVTIDGIILICLRSYPPIHWNTTV
jgi:hypothetical protein